MNLTLKYRVSCKASGKIPDDIAIKILSEADEQLKELDARLFEATLQDLTDTTQTNTQKLGIAITNSKAVASIVSETTGEVIPERKAN
jgi:hypothetical protein